MYIIFQQLKFRANKYTKNHDTNKTLKIIFWHVPGFRKHCTHLERSLDVVRMLLIVQPLEHLS